MSKEEIIYPAGNFERFRERINTRAPLIPPNLREEWSGLEAQFKTTPDGESILEINGLEVMASFQVPYMKTLAALISSNGGRILNVGHGLGIADDFIQQIGGEDISEHHIIELNKDVYHKCLAWKNRQEFRDRIFVHLGDWQTVLPELEQDKVKFDGVLYDGYPLEVEELCRDAVPFLGELLKLKLVKEVSGRVTFFLDSLNGMSEAFQEYLKDLGVREISQEKIQVELPQNHKDRQCWQVPYFQAPLLTNIQYPES